MHVSLQCTFRETLTYWVQRMEPLIQARTEDEILVVFCNRCGMEDDTVFAGTSAVIGIKKGEVRVYGLLGRCENKVLVVDTDTPPFGRLDLETQKDDDGEPL